MEVTQAIRRINQGLAMIQTVHCMIRSSTLIALAFLLGCSANTMVRQEEPFRCETHLDGRIFRLLVVGLNRLNTDSFDVLIEVENNTSDVFFVHDFNKFNGGPFAESDRLFFHYGLEEYLPGYEIKPLVPVKPGERISVKKRINVTRFSLGNLWEVQVGAYIHFFTGSDALWLYVNDVPEEKKIELSKKFNAYEALIVSNQMAFVGAIPVSIKNDVRKE
jgi:hypothetical protein